MRAGLEASTRHARKDCARGVFDEPGDGRLCVRDRGQEHETPEHCKLSIHPHVAPPWLSRRGAPNRGAARSIVDDWWLHWGPWGVADANTRKIGVAIPDTGYPSRKNPDIIALGPNFHDRGRIPPAASADRWRTRRPLRRGLLRRALPRVLLEKSRHDAVHRARRFAGFRRRRLPVVAGGLDRRHVRWIPDRCGSSVDDVVSGLPAVSRGRVRLEPVSPRRLPDCGPHPLPVRAPAHWIVHCGALRRSGLQLFRHDARAPQPLEPDSRRRMDSGAALRRAARARRGDRAWDPRRKRGAGADRPRRTPSGDGVRRLPDLRIRRVLHLLHRRQARVA